MKAFIIYLLATAVQAFAWNRFDALEDLPKINASEFKQCSIKAPIDHFNFQGHASYQQRIWANDKYFDREHGPLFLYICGEYTCSIREDRLYPFMVGAYFKANLVALEHRFYGKSQPFTDLKTENLKYLSSEQALSDIAHAITILNQDKPSRPVIVIGGSYPGALSAWFRQRYPHLTVASWSSSGVVYPKLDFWQFDEQVFRSTVKSGENCPKQIVELFNLTMANMDADPPHNIKDLFGVAKMRNDDFAFFFADIFVETVQYGNRTGLCRLMDQIQNKTFAEKIAAIKEHNAHGPKCAPLDYCRYALSNTTITDSPARAWTYQYCSEFGWYQTPSKVHPMRPQLLNQTYWENYCWDIFNMSTKLNRSLSEYAFNHMAGTNTVFTNGAEDPWQWATEKRPKWELNQQGLMADCTDCGHCADLHTPRSTDAEQLKMVRFKVFKFIEGVLKKRMHKRIYDFVKRSSKKMHKFISTFKDDVQFMN